VTSTNASPSPKGGEGSAPAPSGSIAGQLARETLQRRWYAPVISFLVSVLVIVPAVWLCDWLLPGFHVDEPAGPFVFSAMLALVGVVLQPLLVGAAVRLGWLGVLVAFDGQAVVVLGKGLLVDEGLRSATCSPGTPRRRC
jgi:hypothetical protein